jgi:histidine ammonia-lyase
VRVPEFVRTRVAVLEDDRPPAPDIDAIAQLIESGELERACAMNVN